MIELLVVSLTVRAVAGWNLSMGIQMSPGTGFMKPCHTTMHYFYIPTLDPPRHLLQFLFAVYLGNPPTSITIPVIEKGPVPT